MKVALVQHPPVFLDLVKSLELASALVAEAGRNGAELVAFPETWLTGYPAWVFGRAGWGDPAARSWYQQLVEQSPVVDVTQNHATTQDGVFPLRKICRETGVSVVLGLNERPRKAAGSVYNSLITIDGTGRVRNVHRKLIPTHTERIVWAPGDAAGLRTVDLPFGVLGGLICWEHWNPLIRQTLHRQDEQIHVAAWPDISEPHILASRSYAFEGRCFVLCVGNILAETDVPDELRDEFRQGLDADLETGGWLFPGGSGVIGPDGEWLTPPVTGEVGILYEEFQPSSALAFKHDLDVAGHYTRPELLRLEVDHRRFDGADLRDGPVDTDRRAAVDYAEGELS